MHLCCSCLNAYVRVCVFSLCTLNSMLFALLKETCAVVFGCMLSMAVSALAQNSANVLQGRLNHLCPFWSQMKMSLSGEGNCVRSYRSQMAPGVTNEIGLGVKLNRTGVDMLLLLLQESPQVSQGQVNGQSLHWGASSSRYLNCES